MSSVLIACVSLTPWAREVVARRHPGRPVAVLGEGSRRIEHVNDLAAKAGVAVGMRESAALSRCPDLHVEVLSGPVLATAWREFLELLYSRFSDRIESTQQGTVFLKLSLQAARELAVSLQVPVGVADSQEVAQLAALRAKPGEVKDIVGSAEQPLLAITPLQHLWVLGIGAPLTERLSFLGLRCLGDLLAWKVAQRAAFLGAPLSTRLTRFVRGERTRAVQRWQPGEVLAVNLAFDAPLEEPGQAEAALRDLVPGLLEDLRGRTAAYLSVHADTLGGRLSATRKPKWPLDASGLIRTALLTLSDTQALPLGIDTLTVQLSGFSQASRQVGLWPGVKELDAVREVLDRFPQALVKVQWRDTQAYVHDAQYVWVDWLSGSERPSAQLTLPALASELESFLLVSVEREA
ncbi:Y-family DNA polymerase (plasmid) [Deinococcus sp. KNUC1210]|uniref:Y-family DNA polymerase n=1 Tax=Deinococcus sp. KNUC1210 TaxID=2917691 RepID=UPI001EEFF058|nr:Y-family DNA polymerase [Deinococcus sp. KNUC1210]ULH18045.1 Y-family DNA polymerase [Deinococcus sp. KNUC1210]